MKVTIQGESTSIAGGHFSVVSETGEVIASVRAIETRVKRDASNSYDRHRMSKGDMFDAAVEYVVTGDVEDVCKAIAANMPQAFKDAGFGTVWHKVDPSDHFACYNFLRTLTERGGWYGNTPAAVVKRIRAAWKSNFSLVI